MHAYQWQILCGNKCDLEDQRVVTYEEGQQVADKLGIPFCETSAKTGTRVKEAFEKLVLEIPTHKSTHKVRSLIIFSPLMFILT